uniref:Uncharacterized protein n=1 Tax=Panagrolaimus sp. ES5 TaxID=591445 RepID=A0AC34FQK9_9BILA
MDRRIMVLNEAAREIYNPTNPARTREANNTFENLSDNPENLVLILDYLEHGEKPYSEFIASTTLKRLSEKRINIPINEQLRLANQLLQFLANRAENADRFTLNKLCDVFANISKYNFTIRDSENKTYPFRTSLTEVQNALNQVNAQGTLALELLTAVVQAFDVQKQGEGTSEHRVSHNEFQNKFLREFNSIGITQISQVVEMLKKPSGEQPSITYIRALLEFYRRLLDYEFLGSNFDIEERETVDLPASWRQKIITVYEPIFELYRLLPVTETNSLKLVIQICSSLASVRRTLFDSEERSKIVASLLDGILIVLGNEIFIEFSRFLHRLIRNFTFSDLAKHRSFTNEILPLLSQFTIQAFEAFDTTASNGVFYLLAFWQRISIHASLPIKEDDRVNPLDSIKPIPIAFVQSRMKLCYLSSVGECENPFDDPVSILQFMDHFSGLCRVDLNGMALLLKTIFDENTMILSSNEAGSQQYLLAELKLIYWTYICGSCLDNRDTVRSSFTSEENPEEFDIVLFMNVNILSKYNFERMQHFTSNEVPSNVIELEVAILSAFDRFRLTYLNESNRYFNEIQAQLVERMGREPTEFFLWEIFTEKIVTNIRLWSTVDEIITKTLSLFGAITSSISLTRKTLNLRTIQFVISHHDAEHFPFLGSLSNKDVLRSRTLFYSSIMRLVVNAIDGNDTIFEEFMKPLDLRINQIKQCLNQRSGFESDGLKMAIAG